jgi:hypothetical protein
METEMLTRRWIVIIVLILPILSLTLIFTTVAADATASASGIVVGSTGPISGATVRVRATDNATTTAPNGWFSLGGLTEGQEVELTAWADGYYVTSAYITPTVSGITLTLRPYHTTDNSFYAWLDPTPNPSVTLQCGNCHAPILPQWQANAHGGAVSNSRFFSLYNGTDITGTMIVSPGFRLDFPGVSGNCANCHAPGAAANAPFTTDMNAIRGDTIAGVQCDFCHKIGGVYLDPATGAPYSNAPGVLSLRLLRPPPSEQIFFGPYDDVKDPDTFLPVIAQSAYCAPCHSFSFWGTPIYQSYNEWLASPYATAGITCQKCHMPPNGDHYFVPPEQGGLWHPAEKIPSHMDLGLKDTAFMTGTIAMTATAQPAGNMVIVTVTLTNVGAGHDVPTDHPGRHLILTVVARDNLGQKLSQMSGLTVPVWGGPQAGLPGKAFAKILQDAATGKFPVVSYWKQSFIVNDNRIPAMGSDTSVYAFSAPPQGGEIGINVSLLFRRAFQPEMETRGWNTPDILMSEKQIVVIVQPRWICYLPALFQGGISYGQP